MESEEAQTPAVAGYDCHPLPHIISVWPANEILLTFYCIHQSPASPPFHLKVAHWGWPHHSLPFYQLDISPV